MVDKILRAIWQWTESALKWLTRLIFNILGKDLSDKDWYHHAQFWKFAAVGCTSTAVQYIAYVIVLALGLHYIIASVISFLVSTLYSFCCNMRYVFPHEKFGRRGFLKAFARTLLSYSLTGVVLQNILLVIFVKFLNISEYLALFLAILICFPVNYLMNKFWTFHKSGKKSSVKLDDLSE